MRKIMVALVAMLLTLGACTSIDCPLYHTVFTTYKFYKPDGTPDTLNNDTMWVVTRRMDGNDTLIINALTGSKATYFNLPVSYMQPEDTFNIFLYNTTSGTIYIDSIYVKKNNFPHFESVDCQASYFHEIQGVRSTHNVIDSIKIINRNANYDRGKEHFHIYLKSDR